MRVKLGDRLKQWLIIAAMVTPPWNIFWWTVGFLCYTLSRAKKHDHSGDAALGLVLGAPVTLPALPFMLWREWRDRRRYEKAVRRNQRAAEWIADRLRTKGIVVSEVGSNSFSLILRADIPDDRKAEFQAIMAEAIRAFPKILPEALFGWSVSGYEHLDRAWAERNGFGEWAEEVMTQPCVDCGAQKSRGFVFGRQRFTAMRSSMEDARHEVRLKDGASRSVDGFICGMCLNRIGWTSMSSGRRPPDRLP